MEELNRLEARQTIGVDLGDKWSQFCVLDDQGEVCEEGRIASTTAAMIPKEDAGSLIQAAGEIIGLIGGDGQAGPF